LRLAKTIIYKVLPLEADLLQRIDKHEPIFGEDGTLIPWPKIDRRVWTWEDGRAGIEPGEKHKFHSTFIVKDAQTILVVTYIKNSGSDREIGWIEQSVVDMGPRPISKGEPMKATPIILSQTVYEELDESPGDGQGPDPEGVSIGA